VPLQPPWFCRAARSLSNFLTSSNLALSYFSRRWCSLDATSQRPRPVPEPATQARHAHAEHPLEDHRLQVFFVCLILVMVAVVHFAIGRADQFIERVSLTHRQLETITELSLRANRYSEQIAEMLLFGKVGVAEFEEARRDLEASFADLERTTRTEIASLEDQAQQAIQRRELALIEQMGTIANRMYDTSLEFLEIVVDGRQEAARRRYFAEIEEDLDDHLQQLIDLERFPI
jgi:hypothetical protein